MWWLQLLSLVVLAGLVQQAPSARHAAGLGWAFAIAWLAGTWWWLFVSMHVYGGLAAPLAAIAVLALAAFLGLYYALATGVARRFGAGGGPGAVQVTNSNSNNTVTINQTVNLSGGPASQEAISSMAASVLDSFQRATGFSLGTRGAPTATQVDRKSVV